MHGIGAHGAIAIKRQRRRRENARRKFRTPQQEATHQQQNMSNKVMGTITMFHVGAVFLTVGCFLMLAAVITNETNKAEIAELIGTGVVCLVIGLFLVILNRFYGQREEEELQNYVESRLARTRSGQRLYHEADSYPEHLDEVGSKTPSMDSGLSNDIPVSKNKKKGKGKAVQSHSSQNNPGPAPTTVNIINEHNHQYHHKTNNPHDSSREEVSGVGVTLDRIGEETDNMRRQNASGYGHDDPGVSRGGNLYRVYDATTA